MTTCLQEQTQKPGAQPLPAETRFGPTGHNLTPAEEREATPDELVLHNVRLAYSTARKAIDCYSLGTKWLAFAQAVAMNTLFDCSRSDRWDKANGTRFTTYLCVSIYRNVKKQVIKEIRKISRTDKRADDYAKTQYNSVRAEEHFNSTELGRDDMRAEGESYLAALARVRPEWAEVVRGIAEGETYETIGARLQVSKEMVRQYALQARKFARRERRRRNHPKGPVWLLTNKAKEAV